MQRVPWSSMRTTTKPPSKGQAMFIAIIVVAVLFIVEGVAASA